MKSTTRQKLFILFLLIDPLLVRATKSQRKITTHLLVPYQKSKWNLQFSIPTSLASTCILKVTHLRNDAEWSKTEGLIWKLSFEFLFNYTLCIYMQLKENVSSLWCVLPCKEVFCPFTGTTERKC